MSEVREQQQKTIWAESEGPARPPEAPASEAVPKPPARFQPINRQQMVLRAVDVERLLEPDHLARAIWEMTGRPGPDALHRGGAGGGRGGGPSAD